MTGKSFEGSAVRDALAKALVVAAACCAFLAESAACQTLPARAVSGIETLDSLVSAEFAKDSIGSITVGVIAGSQLAWTRSVGFAAGMAGLAEPGRHRRRLSLPRCFAREVAARGPERSGFVCCQGVT